MTSGEKQFLKLLEDNGGEYNANDPDLAFTLGITVYSLAKYKKRLKDNGYIRTQLKYVDGKLRCFYKLCKRYNVEDEIKSVTWD